MAFIVPAIISKDFFDLTKKISVVERFYGCPFVQLDIMDGKFVPNKTIGAESIAKLRTQLSYELHLMIHDPLQKIEEFIALQPERLIVHYTSKKEMEQLFVVLKACKIKVAIALNLGTSVAQVEPFLKYIDSVLLMSVVPGSYGAAFHSGIYKKIRAMKKLAPDLPVAIDGGVGRDTIKKLIAAGADRLCVGSRIFETPDPLASYQELKKLCYDR